MSRIFVITFYTHHEALVCFRALQAEAGSCQGLKITLIPVPRELSSSCGTAVKAETEPPAPHIAELLKLAGEYECCCELVDGTYHPIETAHR